ncbi:MAG: hypothetical protein JSV26_11000 [bacterium]|nr:MAG: hypothetical protein JSV26_11000 [bacterium]
MANVLTRLRCSYLYGKAKGRLKKKKFDEAQACLEKILASAEKADDDILLAHAHKFLAEFFLERETFRKACLHAEESLTLLSGLGHGASGYSRERGEVERLLEKIPKGRAER